MLGLSARQLDILNFYYEQRAFDKTINDILDGFDEKSDEMLEFLLALDIVQPDPNEELNRFNLAANACRTTDGEFYAFIGGWDQESSLGYVTVEIGDGKSIQVSSSIVESDNDGDGNALWQTMKYSLKYSNGLTDEVYITYSGIYSSWDSDSWDHITHVMPREVTITEYVRYKK